MSDRLSMRLRDATRRLHREVETTAFVRALVTGTVDRTGYVRYLRSLHPVYAALEGGLASSDRQELADLADPRLERTGRLEADLEFLHGPGWAAGVSPTPAARCYADRLDGLSRAEAHRLVGHWYLRYLGDLSGGPALRGRVAEGLLLTGKQGLSFYEFDGVGEPSTAADTLRARIDRLSLDPTERGQVVAEARRGFRYHLRLFRELHLGESVDRTVAPR